MATSALKPADRGVIPFSAAVKVKQLDSHTYSANLDKSFAIGTVPNGGYLASCMLQAAAQHLKSRNQKDAMTAHLEFLNRSEVGPAVIVVEDIKIGRKLSVLHITFYQHALLDQAPWISESSRKEVVAYVNMTDLAMEKGLSLATAFDLHPKPLSVDLAALARGTDQNWGTMKIPAVGGFRQNSFNNMQYFSPKGGQAKKSVIDLWIRLASGENFDVTSLSYAADCWPYVVEMYRPGQADEKIQGKKEDEPFSVNDIFWYPTVALNLEVKKALPPAGLEWLFLRIYSKQVKNGRLDLDVIIMDAGGEVVALSQHVNLIVGGERNLSKRSTAKGQL